MAGGCGATLTGVGAADRGVSSKLRSLGPEAIGATGIGGVGGTGGAAIGLTVGAGGVGRSGVGCGGMVAPASSFSIRVLTLGAVSVLDVWSGSMTRLASVPVRGVENGAVGCGSVDELAFVEPGGVCGATGADGAGAGGVVGAGACTGACGRGAGAAERAGAVGCAGAIAAGAGATCAPGPAVTGAGTGAGAALDMSGVCPAIGASASTSCTVRTTSSIPTCDFTR